MPVLVESDRNADGKVWFLKCRNCQACGSAAADQEKAITYWNERQNPLE
jgi:hypothetical protein